MKNINFILISISFVISCNTSNVSQKNCQGLTMNSYYIEKKLSFFDPYELTYANGEYQGYTYEKWIREPQNLKMIHETFKKIGYENLIDSFDFYQDPCMIWGYINRPCNEIMDSLIKTYHLDTIESKYYREFWIRREKENNDNIVYEILKEISTILAYDSVIEYDNQLVNDTLYRLIYIDRVQTNPTEQQAISDFEYLKKIGLHSSAYNLLYETMQYQDIIWNRDELVKELVLDSSNCCPIPWIMDDTK